MPTYFLLDPFEFQYSGGIDLGIVHSCMYPYYLLPEYDKSNTGIRTDPEENM